MKKMTPHSPTATAFTAVAAAAAHAVKGAPATKSRGRPRVAKPYQIGGRRGWWANPTLADGTRPLRSFDTEQEALQWLTDTYALAAKAQLPALGGPDGATVAQAFYKYAFRFTVLKGGATAELTRINNYLRAGGLPPLRLVVDDLGRKKLEPVLPRRTDKNSVGFQEYVDVRRELRAETYERIGQIGAMKCSRVTTEILGELATAMEAEGLSESTVQKEFALLKAMFNSAVREWRWKGFVNPVVGIKLGKSKARFVRVSSAEEQRLAEALTRCDNPEMWPFVELAITTTMRKGSLLKMKWSQISLETREVHVWAKGANVTLPLSNRAIELLHRIPRSGSDLVFSMTSNAVKLAWDHVRKNAQLPQMRLADLRHVGATFYAKTLTPHELKAVLGHKSTRMAEVYVNLVNDDVLQALDKSDTTRSCARPLPPEEVHAGSDIKAILAKRRAERLNGKPALPANVVSFPRRAA